MKEFKDKVAVITGAGSGIGHALAIRATNEGMKVVLADIEEEALSQTEIELKTNGADVMAVLTDVTKIDDVKALAQKTLDKYGAVDLLCNNAGVGYYMNSTRYLWESPLEDWNWILNVNLWGVIHGMHVFVPIMLKQDIECHILNTASITGIIPPITGGGIYYMSKHAVVVLSEALKQEFLQIGAKIKVSALCPAFVATKITQSERNHPKKLDINTELNPELEIIIKGMQEAIKTGMSPEKVSDIAFKGIKNDVFYILPHTGLSYKKMVSNRMDGIIEAFKENKAIQKKEIT